MKTYRTLKNGSAIWRVLGHREIHSCPECQLSGTISYLGFVETYSAGLHGKMYQCKQCETWIDVIWDKKKGRYQDNKPAGV